MDQALRGRKINGIAPGLRRLLRGGEAEASQVTNAAFWSLLLSSRCYFSLLQICLDVRTQVWAAAQRGGPGGVWGGGSHLGAPGLGGRGGGLPALLASGVSFPPSQMREPLEWSFRYFHSTQQSLCSVLTMGKDFQNILVKSLILQT